MILLDTNVISEPMNTAPDLKVLAWLDEQTDKDLYIFFLERWPSYES